MRVDRLETEHFRLLASQAVEFHPQVNVICGRNAQGKTTLLEAVYLLTGAKSFRTRFDKELIAFGEDNAFLKGEIFAADRAQRVELNLFRGRSRQLKTNGVKRSAAEMTDNLKAVLFCPDDLQLVRGAAAQRRHSMDMAISQLRPGYRQLLADYGKLYEDKSRILKDGHEQPDLYDALEEFSYGLCLCSARIIRFRAGYLRRLNESAAPIHAEFSAGREALSLAYSTVSTVTNPEASEKEIFEQVYGRWQQLRRAEIDSGQCLVGAHKDDMLISLNGIEAKSFASQGQTRTAALSLKLAEREIFLKETREPPLLLLDDVLSELDGTRQEFVLNRIGGGQTMITCCDESSVSRLQAGRTLRAEGGVITECTCT